MNKDDDDCLFSFICFDTSPCQQDKMQIISQSQRQTVPSV